MSVHLRYVLDNEAPASESRIYTGRGEQGEAESGHMLSHQGLQT